MRYRPNHPEIRERVVAELPEITENLMAITEFDITEVTPKPHYESETSPNTNPADLQRLEWAHLLGSAVWYAGPSYQDTMRTARIMTLRAMIGVRDSTSEQKKLIYGDLPGALLIATRGIISHTPYPKAFGSRKHIPLQAPSIQEYIRTHEQPYICLIPFMEGAQQRITNRALNK